MSKNETTDENVYFVQLAKTQNWRQCSQKIRECFESSVCSSVLFSILEF